MIRDALDNRKFRILFGLFVGFPATLLLLVLSVYGYIFGIIAIREQDLLSAAFAFSTLLGTAGVVGAWIRLLKRSDRISASLRLLIRILLLCGIAASAVLLVITIWAETFLPLGLPLIALIGAGMLFYSGT